jgi:NAD-dependent SIR2 family protein deacetylase
MNDKFCPECRIEMKLHGKSTNHWYCEECGRVWEIWVTGMIKEKPLKGCPVCGSEKMCDCVIKEA